MADLRGQHIGSPAEQAWLCGTPEPGIEAAIGLRRRFDGVGLESVIGDLAVWLQRLDPALATEDLRVSLPHRLQLSGH